MKQTLHIPRIVHAAAAVGLVVALSLVLAACGSRSVAPADQPTATVPTSPPSAPASQARMAPVIHRGVHLPAASHSAPVPLVIGLHGAGGTAAGFQSTGFNSVADRYGFVVAYLNSPSNWRSPSDISYIGSMISQLKASENIDPQRVYVFGFSIGGYATVRSACQLSDQITAIAIVSYVMAPLWRHPCHLTRPIPELNIAGTNDAAPVHPVSGYPVSFDQTAASWRSLDGCSSSSSTATVGPTLETTWSQCNDGASVGEYLVRGGVHAYPGAPGYTGADEEYSATQAIWSFFSRQRLTSTRTAKASLSSLKVIGGKRRSLRVLLMIGEISAFIGQMTLFRNGQVIKFRHFSFNHETSSSQNMTIPRAAVAGRYQLKVKLHDMYDSPLSFTRSVRIPALPKAKKHRTKK